MAWRVSFDPRAFKELEKLDRVVHHRIIRFLQARSERNADPRSSGKVLTGDRGGLWRYRVGDYRLICKIEDDSEVIQVLRLAHRKDVYR